MIRARQAIKSSRIRIWRLLDFPPIRSQQRYTSSEVFMVKHKDSIIGSLRVQLRRQLWVSFVAISPFVLAILSHRYFLHRSGLTVTVVWLSILVVSIVGFLAYCCTVAKRLADAARCPNCNFALWCVLLDRSKEGRLRMQRGWRIDNDVNFCPYCGFDLNTERDV